MATYLLSDEFKSDLLILIPPITNEQIIRDINALIYHFRFFGVFDREEVKVPLNYNLNNITTESILDKEHGSYIARETIKLLNYLYLPIEIDKVIFQLNLIVKIIKNTKFYSKREFDSLRDNLYRNTPILRDREAIYNPSVGSSEESLSERINKINYLNYDDNLSYSSIISLINNIINLFRGKDYIIDSQDLRLLIRDLKTELLNEQNLDYGNISVVQNTKDNYLLSDSTNGEFQKNYIINPKQFSFTKSKWESFNKDFVFTDIENKDKIEEGESICLMGVISDLDYLPCKLFCTLKNKQNNLYTKDYLIF